MSANVLQTCCVVNAGVPPLDTANDRVMPCGSPAMLRDPKKMLEARGFHEGNTTKPGDFVVERAFAEQ